MTVDLYATRAELTTALLAGGFEVAQGAASRGPVPAVLIRPADPWLLRSGTLARDMWRQSWNVVPVAGKADADGTEQELGTLIAELLPVLIGLTGWSTPNVSAYRTVSGYNGTDYLGAELQVTKLIALNGG